MLEAIEGEDTAEVAGSKDIQMGNYRDLR